MSFEESQDGHLGVGMDQIYQFWISMSPQCLPPSFSIIQITLRKQMLFQDFQAGHHGSHLRYWNGMNLAILNLHVTPMPPTKFGLNSTYHSEADVVWIFSRWPPRGGYQNGMILAILNLYVAPMPPIKFQLYATHNLKIFKMTDMAAILDIGME